MCGWIPLCNYFEISVVFCSVTARTEKISSSDLHSLLGELLSLQRKNFSSRFHDAPITPITVFLQRKLLLACNPEMIVRCLLSSTVFHSVTARTAKNVLATLSQKSQKERTEPSIKCDCQTT